MCVEQIFDVKAYGALGNATLGVAGSGHDDAPNIALCVQAALASAQPFVILFPPGIYRFDQVVPGVPFVPSGSVYSGTPPVNFAALQFQGVSNFGIEFTPGAVLQMDTANPRRPTLAGAISIIGPCSNVTLKGVNIQWAAAPSVGFGNSGQPAVAFWGQATEGGAFSINNIRIIGGLTIKNAPMWGVEFSGCEDVQIDSVTLNTSGRDGMHFYSCRRAQIDRVSGYNIGDDLVCLEAPYNPAGGTVGDRQYNPQQVGTLFGEWSNSSFSIGSIMADDCSASALKILGGFGVSVDQVSSNRGGEAAVLVGASAGSPTGNNTYSWPASRGVRIGSIVAIKTIALLIESQPGADYPGANMDTSATLPAGNYPGASADYVSPNYWYHDIQVGSVNCCDVPWSGGFEDGVQLLMAAGVQIGGISVKTSPGTALGTTMASIRLLTVQDVTLGNVEVIGDASISGAANGVFVQGFTGNAGTAAEAQPFNNINISSILTDGCQAAAAVNSAICFSGVRGGNIGPLTAKNSAYSGVFFFPSSDIDIPKIQIIDCNRGDSSTTQLNDALQLGGSRIRVRSLLVRYNKVGVVPNFVSVFIPSSAADCRIDDFQLVSDSVSGPAGPSGGSFTTSSILGSWYNTATGQRGGVSFGRGTFGLPVLSVDDNGNLVELTTDTSENYRITVVPQGTPFPTSTSTGTVL